MENKLIQNYDYDRINKLVPECEEAIKACGNSFSWSSYASFLPHMLFD